MARPMVDVFQRFALEITGYGAGLSVNFGELFLQATRMFECASCCGAAGDHAIGTNQS